MISNIITTSTTTIKIYSNTDKTINPSQNLLNNNQSNGFIAIKVWSKYNTNKYIKHFQNRKEAADGYQSQCKNCQNNKLKNID